MTFLEAVTAAGDFLLERSVGAVDAGACVSHTGQTCRCTTGGCICGCGSVYCNQRWLYSCFGACTQATNTNCCSYC